MHVIDMFIFISIGQVVSWIVALYMKGQTIRLIGHAFVATAGSFLGGYLSLKFFSEIDKFSMIFSAFVGSIILLYVIRLHKWKKQDPG